MSELSDVSTFLVAVESAVAFSLVGHLLVVPRLARGVARPGLFVTWLVVFWVGPAFKLLRQTESFDFGLVLVGCWALQSAAVQVVIQTMLNAQVREIQAAADVATSRVAFAAAARIVVFFLGLLGLCGVGYAVSSAVRDLPLGSYSDGPIGPFWAAILAVALFLMALGGLYLAERASRTAVGFLLPTPVATAVLRAQSQLFGESSS